MESTVRKGWTLTIIIVTILLSITINGCFKHSKDEPITGSSVPAPGAFTLGNPADMPTGIIDLSGSIFSTGLPMTWTASLNVANYLLEIATDDSFAAAYSLISPTFASNITAITVTTTTFVANTLYYWRVKAINASGTPFASNQPFSFYTGTGAFAPGVFDLASPLNSAAGPVSAASPNAESLTPTLQWTNATTETMYTVSVATDTAFTSPLVITNTKPGVLTYDIPVGAGLTNTVRYYWAVTATGYISQTASTTPYYSFVTGPVKYYTLAPDNSTITASGNITATLTAYGNNDVIVSSHTPFSITMNAGTGFTYYTSNTFGTVNGAGTYTVANGTATIYVKMTSSGAANNLIATDPLGRTKTTVITVNPGPATQLIWFVSPATPQAAGTAWTPAPVVRIADASGNTVNSSAVVTLVTVTGTSSFASGYTATASAGLATFNVALYNKAETITAKATAAGLTDSTTTGSIVVDPGAATKVLWVTAPATPQTAGTNWATFTAEVTDANNNRRTADNTTVVSVVTVTGTTGFASGYTATASAGLATFNVALYNKAETISVKATAAGLTDSTTIGSIVVDPGAPSAVVFSTQPANTVAGANMANVVVNVKDAYANNISGQNVTVALSPTGVTPLGGTLTQATNASGNATFGNLVITLTGTYALTGTAGTVNIASANFTITAAALDHFNVSVATTSPVSGTGYTETNAISARDVYNNLITIDASVVTATITNTVGVVTMTYYTAGDYLTPTPTYTLVNGLATIYYKATRDATVGDTFQIWIRKQTDTTKQGVGPVITVN